MDKRRAKKFYQYLKNAETHCKTNEDVLALSFDYMQNLHLPETPVQDLFLPYPIDCKRVLFIIFKPVKVSSTYATKAMAIKDRTRYALFCCTI